MYRLLLLLVLFGHIAIGQSSVSDDSESVDVSNLFSDYQSKIGRGSAIWNGQEYTGGDPSISGHQYFITKNFQYGSLVYKGNYYDSLLLAYDIYLDELVLVFSETGEFFTITPQKDFVEVFTLGAHRFIRPDALSGEEGYFELLYNGPTTALAKRKKITTPFREGNFLYKYRESDSYFIFHQESFVEIGSKGSFLKLFKERKKEFKSYIRKHSLDFGSNPAQFLSVMCNYVDNPDI